VGVSQMHISRLLGQSLDRLHANATARADAPTAG
jgi:DNA-directed RNA polymerase specialized sigma subunit